MAFCVRPFISYRLDIAPCISCDRFVSIFGRLFNIGWCVKCALAYRSCGKPTCMWLISTIIFYMHGFSMISFNNFITFTMYVCVCVSLVSFFVAQFPNTQNWMHAQISFSTFLYFVSTPEICKCRWKTLLSTFESYFSRISFDQVLKVDTQPMNRLYDVVVEYIEPYMQSTF